MDKQLKEYIAKSRKGGQTDLQIMNDLAAAGWPEDQILDALRPDLRPPKPPLIQLTPKQLKMVIFIGGGVLMCTILIVIFGILISGSRKTNNKIEKKNGINKTSNHESPDKNSDGPEINKQMNDYPAGTTVLFTRQNHSGDMGIKFYDTLGQKLISALDETKFGTVSAISITPWSPDGRYTFFQLVERKDDYQNDTYSIYLYDASKRITREIAKYYAKISEKEPDLVTNLRKIYSLNKKRWYDDTRLILSISDATAGGSSYITMGVDGKLETIKIEGDLKLLDTSYNTADTVLNNLLAFQVDKSSVNLDTFEWKYKVLINNTELPGAITELPIGIKGESIIALNQPKLNFAKSLDPEFQNQVTTLRNEGKTEQEIYEALKDQLLPTSPASISYISASSGNIITSIELEDKNKYVVYGIYAQKTNLIYLFRLDSPMLPKIEQGLQLNPLTKETKLLYERKTSKNFDSLISMHNSGNSYQINADNNLLFTRTPRAEDQRRDPEIPEYPITVVNLDTLESTEICDIQCGNLTVYNPYQIK